MPDISITRSHHRLLPDARRVFAKPYLPGEEAILPGHSRGGLLLNRIMAIPESEVAALVKEIRDDFSSRHRNFDKILEDHSKLAAQWIEPHMSVSSARRMLIGAYFTHEYSVEAAALFNPSIVLSPDQRNLAAGHKRFVMSLRAVGEGHLSSIEFRSGTIDAAGDLHFDSPGPYLVAGRRTPPPRYDKHLFVLKLMELGGWNDLAKGVVDRLPEGFDTADLEDSLAILEKSDAPRAIWFETAKIIRVLASSNYVVSFPMDTTLSERILFPAGPNETRGMEDARFVQFTEGDTVKYYATYTAYDGFQIMPQLIETVDFVTFQIATLNGVAAQNKGMAMFPRKINNRYVMLSRRDRENLHLATSDNVRFWNEVTELQRPSQPWELLQIGNCGAPLETEEGWLVLTHGVGPMRRYTIGALLLDLEDPRRVLGSLRRPLLVPNETEREGYVPNVLYTCGGLINGDQLILPYGFSDAGIGIAKISLPEILSALKA